MAYAIGLVLSYLVQIWEGRSFCAWQASRFLGLEELEQDSGHIIGKLIV